MASRVLRIRVRAQLWQSLWVQPESLASNHRRMPPTLWLGADRARTLMEGPVRFGWLVYRLIARGPIPTRSTTLVGPCYLVHQYRSQPETTLRTEHMAQTIFVVHGKWGSTRIPRRYSPTAHKTRPNIPITRCSSD